MKFLVLLLIFALSLFQQSSSHKPAALLEYCNKVKLKDRIVNCRQPYVCNQNYHQCLVPKGHNCTTTVQCDDNHRCYNNICTQVNDIPKCNTNHSMGTILHCPNGFVCNNLRKQCEVKHGLSCNGKFTCEAPYACHHGKCVSPELFDTCDPASNVKCNNGLICHDFWYACLVPENGDCRSTSECGGVFTLVCVNGKCRKPSLNQRCNPTQTYYLPKTICSSGLCDFFYKKCKIPINGLCFFNDHCAHNTSCKRNICQ